MNDVAIREKQITRTSLVGVAANIALAAVKALIGLAAGSISIVMDAVNNLTDAMSSVITIVGIKLAQRKPNNEHPFGHGRIEYFSAIIIAALVLTAGVMSLKESVISVIHPGVPDYSPVTVLTVVVAVAAKLVLGRYVTAQGKKYNSDALIASGADASFDALISASTLVGAATAVFLHITIDGIIGSVISLLIIKAGVEMLMESLDSVIGCRPEAEVTRSIKQHVAQVEGVLGAYDLVLHNYGPNSAMGSVHVEVPAGISAAEIHRITKAVQLKILEEFHIFLTVGIYAVDPRYDLQRQAIRKTAKAYKGVINTHGVFIDEEKKYVSFDVMTDFTVPDRETLVKEIADKVSQNILPGYRVDISLDTNYSD